MALAAVCRAPGRRAHARGDQGTRGKASASHKAESQLAPSRPDRPGLRVTRHGDHRRDKHDDTLRTLRHPHRLRLGDSDGGIGATGPGTGQPTSAHSGGSTGNPGYVPPKSRQEICCSRPGLLSPKITPINTAWPAPATPTKRSCFWVQFEIFGSHPPTSRKWEKEELQFALGGFPRCSTATVISCSMPPMEALINGW